MPFERARTLLALGLLQRRRNERRRAHESLTRRSRSSSSSAHSSGLQGRDASSVRSAGARRAARDPDAGRTAGRRAGRQRTDEPPGRGRPLHQPEDRRVDPRARLPQARHPLARRARRARRTRRRRRHGRAPAAPGLTRSETPGVIAGNASLRSPPGRPERGSHALRHQRRDDSVTAFMAALAGRHRGEGRGRRRSPAASRACALGARPGEPLHRLDPRPGGRDRAVPVRSHLGGDGGGAPTRRPASRSSGFSGSSATDMRGTRMHSDRTRQQRAERATALVGGVLAAVAVAGMLVVAGPASATHTTQASGTARLFNGPRPGRPWRRLRYHLQGRRRSGCSCSRRAHLGAQARVRGRAQAPAAEGSFPGGPAGCTCHSFSTPVRPATSSSTPAPCACPGRAPVLRLGGEAGLSRGRAQRDAALLAAQERAGAGQVARGSATRRLHGVSTPSPSKRGMTCTW